MTKTSADENRPKGYALHRTIVLVGMMGSGKTAIGRALSAVLGRPFLDSDAEIENAAQQTIAEIFERDGEPFFRKRETEVIDRLLSGPPVILSTGGGAFLAEHNRTAISKKGTSVWLDASLSVLWDRVRNKDTRPLLRTPDPKATLTEIFDARSPIYQRADMHMKIAPRASIERTTQGVVDLLLTNPQILERSK